MNDLREPLSSRLCRLAGKHKRCLPDISEYTRYIQFRDEEIRQNIRAEDVWNAAGPAAVGAVRCTSMWCVAVVADRDYNLCAAHSALRLELKTNYHLYNQEMTIHANPSVILFREIQLRQLYLERYGLRPNKKHDDWLLSLLSDISWGDLRARGELQNDILVHRALNRPYYRTPAEHFERFQRKLARMCGCSVCEENFPEETLCK